MFALGVFVLFHFVDHVGESCSMAGSPAIREHDRDSGRSGV
jgi:hypothetical protein